MNKLLNFFRDKTNVAENPQTDSEVLNPNTPIHNDLTSFYLVLVEELKKFSDKEYNELEWRRNELIDSERQWSEINIRPIEREIENEKAYLAKLGFSNAKTERLENLEIKLASVKQDALKIQNEKENIVSKISDIEYQQVTKEILQRLKKDFGEEALFVRYDDFEKVINKYNLVCGRISDYKGVLPEYKMADVNRVLTMDIPEFWKDKISRLEHETESASRFPFYKLKYSGNLCDSLFITAPVNEMTVNEAYIDSQRRRRTAALIARCMCNESKHRFDDKELEEYLAKDPFICAHTRWGIIIFTKWGEEAEDEIIKKYKR